MAYIPKEEQIYRLFRYQTGDIVKIRTSENNEFDAIVNAAKPTLMGGSGVDGAIHAAFDKQPGRTLNDMIKRELDGKKPRPDNVTRCEPGSAVLTTGKQGLCHYIIHAVGPRWIHGTQSEQAMLKECYTHVMKLVEKYNIHTVVLPIISSGSYGFPFELAARIAIASVYNYLLDWKERDYFKFLELKEITFIIHKERDNGMAILRNIQHEFKSTMRREKRIVYRSVFESQAAYLREIWYNDERRGIFSVSKLFRLLLASSRYLFPISLLLRQFFGKISWQARRTAIEIEALLKSVFPLLACLFYRTLPDGCRALITGLSVYFMAETVLYLMSLIFLGDIQGPAANAYRSLILLFINYLEISFEYAYVMLFTGWSSSSTRALVFGLTGEWAGKSESAGFMTVQCVHTFTSIFLSAVALSYILNSLKGRRYLKG